MEAAKRVFPGVRDFLSRQASFALGGIALSAITATVLPHTAQNIKSTQFNINELFWPENLDFSWKKEIAESSLPSNETIEIEVVHPVVRSIKRVPAKVAHRKKIKETTPLPRISDEHEKFLSIYKNLRARFLNITESYTSFHAQWVRDLEKIHLPNVPIQLPEPSPKKEVNLIAAVSIPTSPEKPKEVDKPEPKEDYSVFFQKKEFTLSSAVQSDTKIKDLEPIARIKAKLSIHKPKMTTHLKVKPVEYSATTLQSTPPMITGPPEIPKTARIPANHEEQGEVLPEAWGTMSWMDNQNLETQPEQPLTNHMADRLEYSTVIQPLASNDPSTSEPSKLTIALSSLASLTPTKPKSSNQAPVISIIAKKETPPAPPSNLVQKETQDIPSPPAPPEPPKEPEYAANAKQSDFPPVDASLLYEEAYGRNTLMFPPKTSTFSQEGSNDSRVQWWKAEKEEYWTTLFLRNLAASERVPIIHKNTLNALTTLRKSQAMDGTSVVYGTLPSGWKPSISARADGPMNIDEKTTLRMKRATTDENSFLYWNVEPGVHILSIEDEEGKKRGSVTVYAIAGLATFLDLSAPVTESVEGTVFSATSKEALPLPDVQVSLVGTGIAPQFTNESGRFHFPFVTRYGKHPIYVETESQEGPKHRYKIQSTSNPVFLFRFTSQDVQDWVHQLEGGISPGSGILVSAFPKLLKKMKTAKLHSPVIQMENGSNSIEPETYSIQSRNDLKIGDQMGEGFKRFLTIQIPDGLGKAVVENLDTHQPAWSELFVPQSDVVHLLGE